MLDNIDNQLFHARWPTKLHAHRPTKNRLNYHLGCFPKPQPRLPVKATIQELIGNIELMTNLVKLVDGSCH